MAFRNLRRRKSRTILTVSGIVIGVGMILVLLSLTAGTSAQASGLLRNVLNAEITVVNSTRPSFSGFGGSGGFGGGGGGGEFRAFFGAGNTISQSVVNEIGNMNDVYATSPQLTITGYVNGSSVFLYGIDPSTYSTATNGLTITSGSMFSSTASANQIVLESTFASNENVTVGSTVWVGTNSSGANSTDFTVVGLYSSGSTFGPLTRSAYISLQNAQTLGNDNGKVTDIFVKAMNPSQVSQLASNIDSSISGVTAITDSNAVTSASALSGTLTTFFTIIGLVALLAGGFGVVNTMMMSVSERVREIGTLKAIGARRSQVLRIFLNEAFLIGLIGGIIGVFIGAVVTFALPSFTSAASEGASFGGFFRGELAPTLTASNLLLSFLLGTIVGVLAGFYPAWRASRMNTVEALRHV